jgi:hypothetical protein
MSRNSFPYVEVKREKIGLCNICSVESSLTWDHVPPSGGIELTSVEIKSILQNFTSSPNDSKPLISQNGLKYRTICSKCNNLMGRDYDPVLNDFALGVGRFLRTSLTLPPVVTYRTKPAVIARAVFGHVLAAKAQYDQAKPDVAMRSVMLNPNDPIPSELHVYYWLYPYDGIVVFRNIGMPAVRGKFSKIAFFEILKYFPVAYLVTDAQPYEGLDELTVHRSIGLSDEADLHFHLKAIRPFDWPEKIDPGNFIIGGQSLASSVNVVPKTKIRRTKGRTR